MIADVIKANTHTVGQSDVAKMQYYDIVFFFKLVFQTVWLLFFAFRSLKVFDFILFRVMTVGGNMATLKNVYRHTHGAKLLSRCLVFVCFFILQTIYHLNPTNSVHRDVSTTTSKIETKTLISDVVIVLNSSVTVIINYKQLGKKARLSN